MENVCYRICHSNLKLQEQVNMQEWSCKVSLTTYSVLAFEIRCTVYRVLFGLFRPHHLPRRRVGNAVQSSQLSLKFGADI